MKLVGRGRRITKRWLISFGVEQCQVQVLMKNLKLVERNSQNGVDKEKKFIKKFKSFKKN